MSKSQSKLVEESETSRDQSEVYVVLGNYPDDPHPHLEAVYDSEDAAERHADAIGGSISLSAPTAWGTHSAVVRSEVSECPICGCEDYRLRENRPDPVGPEARCRNCSTTWRMQDDQ